MTVLVGLTPGERVSAAALLGAFLARSAGRPLVVAAVVPEPWPPDPFRSDEEFLAVQTAAAEQALADVRSRVGESDTDFVLRRARSVSSGLLEVAEETGAEVIVLGSSHGGALNRVTLGGVADRILHSSGVPVVVAPRGYHFRPAARLTRVTVGFGRGDGDSDLLARAAERAAQIGAQLRVACFAVQPLALVASMVGAGDQAENLVTDRWVASLRPLVDATIKGVVDRPSAEPVDVVVGRGSSWAEALTDIHWDDEEILVIGTSNSSVGRLFLGSHAAKIVRNSPVPVMLVPRSVTADANHGG